MIRKAFLERNIVQIYGGFPEDDAEITYDLLNSWMADAIANAAKQCYVESIKLDGVAYVNNSFYTTFAGLSVLSDDTSNQGYKIELPEIPVGIGKNEGVSTLQFRDDSGFVSLPVIWLNMNQQGYSDSMRPIPNKILGWSEGKYIRLKTPLILTEYTAIVKMISGGDSQDLNSQLNVPPDYHEPMVEYLKKQMAFEKSQRPDINNDGNDIP
jgi:hypothetical protein